MFACPFWSAPFNSSNSYIWLTKGQVNKPFFWWTIIGGPFSTALADGPFEHHFVQHCEGHSNAPFCLLVLLSCFLFLCFFSYAICHALAYAILKFWWDMVYNNYLNKRICLIGCLVKKEQKTKKRKEKEEVAIFHVNDDILSPERLTYKITFFAGECLTFFLKCFFFWYRTDRYYLLIPDHGEVFWGHWVTWYFIWSNTTVFILLSWWT